MPCGYLCRVYTDARRPVFMPLWNYAFNQGGPDPDYVYSTTEIDPTACTGSPGYRGTTRFVEITQQSFDMMSPAHMDGSTRLRADQRPRRDVALDDDGSFSVVLSAGRGPPATTATGGSWTHGPAGS